MTTHRTRFLDIAKLPFDIDLVSPAYSLGERSLSFKDIENYQATGDQLNIDFDRVAPIFGCSQFWATSQTPFELAFDSAKKTLSSGDVAAEEIDMVMLCGNAFVEKDEERLLRKTGHFIASLGCEKAMPVGASLQACATLISGIETATLMLNTYPDVNHILLVGVDISASDQERLTGFGLFSDAASSFVLSRTTKGMAQRPLKATNFIAAGEVMAEPDADKAAKQDVVTQLHTTLFNQFKQDASIIERVFSVNIFRPFFGFLMMKTGFNKPQFYTKNLTTKGHSWNSDIIINMCDYFDDDVQPRKGYFLLSSFTFGLGGAVIFEVR
ncbi:beta-ketoacyl-[acyl-carrier-protein] synthase family protein [Teredinibacter purpureus]|uniref:hypothetical protein n=1 Tax=Teredinibacter purpureus TaxID=2731756 RepID=UPI0005F83CF2|nr:hypothetical protein [Teredinibacter purpureus]